MIKICISILFVTFLYINLRKSFLYHFVTIWTLNFAFTLTFVWVKTWNAEQVQVYVLKKVGSCNRRRRHSDNNANNRWARGVFLLLSENDRRHVSKHKQLFNQGDFSSVSDRPPARCAKQPRALKFCKELFLKFYVHSLTCSSQWKKVQVKHNCRIPISFILFIFYLILIEKYCC